MSKPKRTLSERLTSARKWWSPPYVNVLRPVQLVTWTLADLGWQFPESARYRYVMWRSGNEWPGPGFPWTRHP